MAQKKQIALRKQALITQLAESRQAIGQSRTVMRDKLNVKKQVTSLVKRKPKAMFAGSAILGLLATLLLRRKNKKKTKKPVKKLITGWALMLAKPAAKKWVKKRVKSYAIGKLRSTLLRRQGQLAETHHQSTS